MSETPGSASPAWLSPKLACPLCGAALERAPALLTCIGCRAAFRQPRGWIDLLSSADLAEEADWSQRLEECDSWYNELIEDPAHAARLLTADYAPFAARLGAYRGDVLDIGGGNGLPRAYLTADANYVSLEPSLDWLQPNWSAVASFVPALARPPAFVRGIGENLPFADASFDVVLMFWSLNHVGEPERVIDEIARVLRPGGEALIVLEDMPPRWSDLPSTGLRGRGVKAWLRLAAQKASHALSRRPWPLQDDHVRITEDQMVAWTHEWSGRERHWVGGYLAYALER